jgi:hypothetical protein
MASAPSSPHRAPVMSILSFNDVPAGAFDDPGGDGPALGEGGGVVQVVLLGVEHEVVDPQGPVHFVRQPVGHTEGLRVVQVGEQPVLADKRVEQRPPGAQHVTAVQEAQEQVARLGLSPARAVGAGAQHSSPGYPRMGRR